METSFMKYDVDKSVDRIKNILKAKNSDFQEESAIPSRSKLTFTNGFYVDVAALFMDIRQSSKLTDKHNSPKLARLYRSYISESVAILNSFTECKEVNIVGDCVSGIFEGEYKSQIEEIFSAAAKLNTLVKIVNYMLEKNGIVEISIGIGICFGRSLMIKAGYSGSKINEVVWMGNVVNNASNLCNQANKDFDYPILVSNGIYKNLGEKSKKMLYEVSGIPLLYGGNIVNVPMNDWFEENCTTKTASLFEMMGFWDD